MAEATSNAGYDVFLCHNSKDKPQVRELAALLREKDLRVYFDEAEMVAGQPWQPALEAAIETSKAALILVGPSGLGPWAEREMRAFDREFVRRKATVIPVLLPGAPAGFEFPLFLREFHRVDLHAGLASGVDGLVAGIRSAPAVSSSQPKPFRLWNVPPLPNTYQARSELEALRQKLLSSTSENPLALTGQHTLFALEGMGGVGKTVLATALARDSEVRRAFPGGVYWLTFGQTQTPESLLELQTRLASAVLGHRVILEASTSDKQHEEIEQLLRDAFSSRACLLILDDVWQYEHAKPFNVMGDLGRLFVTTRNREIALSLGADSLDIKQLEKSEAISLLAAYAGLPLDSLPPEGPDLARACGELPLALAVVGSSLRGRPANQWGMRLKRLRQGVLPDAGHPLPNYSHPSVVAALQASVDDLPADVRSRYVDLAVFPEDVAIPEAVLRTYWAPEVVDEERVAELVNAFADRSLARRDDKGRVLLHDLQHDHVRAVAGDLKPLHRRLVDAYRRKGAFHLLKNDGYFHEHIARHVLEADGPDGLRALLSDDGWLSARLRATDINALLGDFELLNLGSDKTFRLIHDALRLSAHVLARHPEELFSQLLARLRGALGAEPVGFFAKLLACFRGALDAELARFCSQLEIHAVPPSLVPLWPSLTRPGGALLGTLEGHRGSVNGVALSGDGKTAVSVSDDNTLKVWDVATGKALRTLEGHGGTVRAVALSADGKTAVSSSDDNTLKVWDAAIGKALHTLEGHDAWVMAVALTGDGKIAVSGSADNTLKVWDVAAGKALRTLEGHGGTVRAVALSGDGKTAVSSSDDKTLNVWDVTTGKMLRTLRGHGESVMAVALSEDGKIAVSGSLDKTLKTWDVGRGKALRTLEGHGGTVRAVAVSADGKTAVSGSRDNTLRVWDVATGEALRTLEGHGAGVNALALSGDGKAAISGSVDRTLKVWDVGSAKALRTIEDHDETVWAVALSGDGKTAVFTSSKSLNVWDAATGKALLTLEGHRNWVRAAALSVDGKTAIFGSADKTLKVLDVGSGKALRSLKGHDAEVMAVALSGDGKTAVSGSADKTLKAWNVATRTVLRTFGRHGGTVRAVALSGDGKIAVSASSKTLKVWDVTTGDALRILEGHGDRVRAVTLSGDGKTAASGSEDKTLRVWEIATGKALRTFEGHGQWVNAVALSVDGKTVVSGSDDKTLKVWDVPTGQCVATFSAEAPVNCVALQASRVFAGDDMGHVHLFALKL